MGSASGLSHAMTKLTDCYGRIDSDKWLSTIVHNVTYLDLIELIEKHIEEDRIGDRAIIQTKSALESTVVGVRRIARR